jgi:hypothetical protein
MGDDDAGWSDARTLRVQRARKFCKDNSQINDEDSERGVTLSTSISFGTSHLGGLGYGPAGANREIQRQPTPTSNPNTTHFPYRPITILPSGLPPCSMSK